MPYRADNLDALLRRQGTLSPERTLRLGLDLARALAEAHPRGVIHRDLKPQNILLDEQGRPELSDFGLGKRLFAEGLLPLETFSLTEEGSTIGSLNTMAPEQMNDAKTVGPAADVYALGATLYRCLAGVYPFQAASQIELVMLAQKGQAPRLSGLRPEAPPELVALIHRCLARNPRRRPRDGAALVEALEEIEARSDRHQSRRRGLAVALGALALSVAVLGALSLRPESQKPPPPSRAAPNATAQSVPRPEPIKASPPGLRSDSILIDAARSSDPITGEALAITGDGDHLLSVHGEAIALWRAASGEQLWRRELALKAPAHAAILSGRAVVAAATDAGGALKVLDLETGKPRLETSLPSPPASLTADAFRGRAVVGLDAMAVFLDLERGRSQMAKYVFQGQIVGGRVTIGGRWYLLASSGQSYLVEDGEADEFSHFALANQGPLQQAAFIGPEIKRFLFKGGNGPGLFLGFDDNLGALTPRYKRLGAQDITAFSDEVALGARGASLSVFDIRAFLSAPDPEPYEELRPRERIELGTLLPEDRITALGFDERRRYGYAGTRQGRLLRFDLPGASTKRAEPLAGADKPSLESRAAELRRRCAETPFQFVGVTPPGPERSSENPGIEAIAAMPGYVFAVGGDEVTVRVRGSDRWQSTGCDLVDRVRLLPLPGSEKVLLAGARREDLALDSFALREASSGRLVVGSNERLVKVDRLSDRITCLAPSADGSTPLIGLASGHYFGFEQGFAELFSAGLGADGAIIGARQTADGLWYFMTERGAVWTRRGASLSRMGSVVTSVEGGPFLPATLGAFAPGPGRYIYGNARGTVLVVGGRPRVIAHPDLESRACQADRSLLLLSSRNATLTFLGPGSAPAANLAVGLNLFEGEELTALAFAPDGRGFYAGSSRGFIYEFRIRLR